MRSAFHINGNEQSSQVDVTAAAFDTLLDNKSHSERINDSEAETTPSAAATAPAAAAAAAAAVTGSRPPEPGTDPTNKRQVSAMHFLLVT